MCDEWADEFEAKVALVSAQPWSRTASRRSEPCRRAPSSLMASSAQPGGGQEQLNPRKAMNGNLPSGWSKHESFGGADRTRTDDFLLAKQALYQLSYGPR